MLAFPDWYNAVTFTLKNNTCFIPFAKAGAIHKLIKPTRPSGPSSRPSLETNKQIQITYRDIASTSSFCLKAHAGFLRLSIKGKFDVYIFIVTFWETVDFHDINTQ